MASPKRGPAGLSYYGRNNSSTWQAIEKIKSGPKNVRPIIIRSPAPEWSEKPKKSSHEGSGNADGESPGHGIHMSSRQTLGKI